VLAAPELHAAKPNKAIVKTAPPCRPVDLAAALNRMMDGIDPNIPLTVGSWPDVFEVRRMDDADFAQLSFVGHLKSVAHKRQTAYTPKADLCQACWFVS
jgi:hypothetical protein